MSRLILNKEFYTGLCQTLTLELTVNLEAFFVDSDQRRQAGLSCVYISRQRSLGARTIAPTPSPMPSFDALLRSRCFARLTTTLDVICSRACTLASAAVVSPHPYIQARRISLLTLLQSQRCSSMEMNPFLARFTYSAGAMQPCTEQRPGSTSILLGYTVFFECCPTCVRCPTLGHRGRLRTGLVPRIYNYAYSQFLSVAKLAQDIGHVELGFPTGL